MPHDKPEVPATPRPPEDESGEAPRRFARHIECAPEGPVDDRGAPPARGRGVRDAEESEQTDDSASQ